VILLDTHAWIWWHSEPDRLSERARVAIDGATRVGVSPVSCWELATKVAKGRLVLDREVDVWVRQALAHPRAELVPLTAEIAVAAGLLGRQGFHGDPADRMIAATALHHGVLLVTRDRAIREHLGARAVW